jgi:signal transduction histidine kinase
VRTLPARFWLWLLILAAVAVPILATVALVVRGGPPPGELRVLRALDPDLRDEIAGNVAWWGDAAWQAQLAPRLAAAGVEALLIDRAGHVLYHTSGWQQDDRQGTTQGDRPPPSAAVVTLTPPGGDGAIALLHISQRAAMPPPPEPPWFNNDFWRIPLAQIGTLLVIMGAIALFVHSAFLRPLSRMVDAMRRVGAGDLGARLPRSRVTEVDQVATAFDAMADALRTSLERQEALEQERRMTISAVVHDLRTPLFSLRGYLEGLATGLADSPEKAARYIRVCREKADALERLVSDLFAYTRTEYLEEVPRPEPIDLGELLRRTVEGLQPQAEAKGVRLAIAASPEPATVAGDPALLMRAVENVLDNAVRHTPTGGEIDMAWRQNGDDTTFTVTDSGPGIAPADLPHLFTPLYRGEASRNRRTGGAGLGLAIARRVLRAHGGDLTAANAPNGGAIFTGVLPGLEKAAMSADLLQRGPSPQPSPVEPGEGAFSRRAVPSGD